MRLTIATPEALLLQRDGIVALRAQDESGAFGILPGHAPFLTALAPSVVSWREQGGKEGHCAVRGGVLTVDGSGQEIAIATRQAVLDDDIARLEHALREELAAAAAREQAERVSTAQLQAMAIRRIIGLLRPGPRPPGAGGAA